MPENSNKETDILIAIGGFLLWGALISGIYIGVYLILVGIIRVLQFIF